LFKRLLPNKKNVYLSIPGGGDWTAGTVNRATEADIFSEKKDTLGKKPGKRDVSAGD